MWITLLIIFASLPVGLLLDWAMWTRAMVWIDPCLYGSPKETYRSSLSPRIILLSGGIFGVGVGYHLQFIAAGCLGILAFLIGHGMGVWNTYRRLRSDRL